MNRAITNTALRDKIFLLCAWTCIFASPVGCGFNIDEAAERIPITVTWKDKTVSVCYSKFSNIESAKEMIEEKPADLLPISSGETILLTRLRSGFGDVRKLDRFLVFQYQSIGETEKMKLVEVTDSILEERKIELSFSELK